MKRQIVFRAAGLAAVLLLTAAAAAAYFKRHDAPMRIRTEETAFLPRFNPESVTEIRMELGDQSLVMRAKDGTWVLPDWEDAPASRQEIVRLLTGLAKAVPLREIRGADEPLLRSLSLSTEPGLLPGVGEGRGAGIRLSVSENGAEVLRLVLGLAHERKTQSMTLAGTGQKEYDGRYLRLDGEDGRPHVFLVSRVFENCIPYPSRWLEPLVFDPAAAQTGIDRIQYERADSAGKYAMVWLVLPDPALKMFVLAAPAGAKLSHTLLTRYVETLTSPFSRTLIRTEDAKDLRFTDRLTMVCHNGVVYKLDLVKRKEGEAAAKLHAEFHPGRFPRKTGESAEDHEKRMREQAYKIDQFNRNFGGRVYSIRPDLPDLLAAVPEEKDAEKKENP